MLSYPAAVRRDGSGFTLVFRDFEFGGHTCGDNESDAAHHAPDALKTVLSLYMEKGLDIPVPSTARGKDRMIALRSTAEGARVALYQATKAAGTKRALGMRRSVRERP